MQSTFKIKRKQLIEGLFNHSQKIYTKLFKQKKKPWNISTEQLLNFKKNTLGYQLGAFLQSNNFDLLAKLERHDCYHIMTNYGFKAQDEIALQYLCFANGKRSPYTFLVLFFGTIILPDYYKYYKKSYQIGKEANTFHAFDYQKLLQSDLETIQSFIFSKNYLKTIHHV